MATKKKMLQAAAGNAGGAGLNVEDVFSTYLYTGNGSTQTITNGIDLAGEGGMTWIKLRNSASNNELYDTERGATNSICSNITNATIVRSTSLTSFNSDGFTLGAGTNVNANNYTVASWTFRKAPKFFDVVTWTGTDSTHAISHNLGAEVGFMVVKRTSSGTGEWYAYHRSAISGHLLKLNTTDASSASTVFNNVTSTSFTVNGGSYHTNAIGETYVAYLFAHNDGDGEFGPDADQDIIKCGTFTTSSSAEFDVDLGFEPSFVLTKRTDSTGNWDMFDTMRGFPNTTNGAKVLRANLANSEGTLGSVGVTSTGFKTYDTLTYPPNATYIYMAIRRGPLAQPESGTEVFNPALGGSGPGFPATFPIDLTFMGSRTGTDKWYIFDRITGGTFLRSNTTAAETVNAAFSFFQNNANYYAYRDTLNTNYIGHSFRRAPGFFDVVAYTGNGTAGRTVSHNLGVAPEMIWAKQRSSSGNSWRVWYEGVPSGKMLRLNGTDGVFNETSRISDADATTFTLNDGTSGINGSGSTYIAYLFASLDGISKVGSYTGNGTSQTIDCGFASGARFILIKRTDSTGDWYVWDTERGIVAGNDPHLSLNTTAAEVTTDDSIDPDSSGFIVNQVSATNINVSSAEYIFYAVA
jgi:hypothetical protein